MERTEKTKSADLQTRPKRDMLQRKKRQNDHSINPYASHSSFVKSGPMSITESAISIIHDSGEDEKCMRNVKRKAPWQGSVRTSQILTTSDVYYTRILDI